MELNFLGFNPMKALVWSGIVQGFSTPPLMLLIMLTTGSHRIMGDQVNSSGIAILGWATTAIVTLLHREADGLRHLAAQRCRGRTRAR